MFFLSTVVRYLNMSKWFGPCWNVDNDVASRVSPLLTTSSTPVPPTYHRYPTIAVVICHSDHNPDSGKTLISLLPSLMSVASLTMFIAMTDYLSRPLTCH